MPFALYNRKKRIADRADAEPVQEERVLLSRSQGDAVPVVLTAGVDISADGQVVRQGEWGAGSARNSVPAGAGILPNIAGPVLTRSRKTVTADAKFVARRSSGSIQTAPTAWYLMSLGA
jgi:hypothetical protein